MFIPISFIFISKVSTCEVEMTLKASPLRTRTCSLGLSRTAVSEGPAEANHNLLISSVVRPVT